MFPYGISQISQVSIVIFVQQGLVNSNKHLTEFCSLTKPNQDHKIDKESYYFCHFYTVVLVPDNYELCMIVITNNELTVSQFLATVASTF